MKIRILVSCFTSERSYTEGEICEVPEPFGEALVKSKYAELVEKSVSSGVSESSKGKTLKKEKKETL